MIRLLRLTFGLAVALLLVASARGDAVVLGYSVQVYASVTDPVRLAFDPSGNLFVGRDKVGSGSPSNGDPVKIHRVAPGGSPVVEYGNAEISDPDSVIFDESGMISGVAGTVLVGGSGEPYGNGQQLVAIHPDEKP